MKILKKDVYEFTKSNIGTLDDRAEKNWFGTIQLDSLGNRYILFSKRKHLTLNYLKHF